MGQKGQKTTDVTRAQDRPQPWVRRGQLGAGALAAVGALAACSGVATNQTQATDAIAKLAPAAFGGSAQGQGAPAMVKQAIAHGRTSRPARRTAHKHSGAPRPSATATPTVSSTGPATPTGTPAATPSGTPSAPPTATPAGGQSGSDPSGQN